MPVVTEGLTKYYGQARGIADLDLEVREGEIFGFLGPNGAGKTTTIRLLLDFIRPSSGRALVFGLDPRRDTLAVRARTGYVPGEINLYEDLSGHAFLDYLEGFRVARAGGRGARERRRSLAERLDVDLRVRLKHASHGTKKKIAIVQALAHDPDLLILDEPTSGLDPLMQQEFYALLLEERSRGKTVFFSSHVLGEVERICDRVAIIREGRVEVVEDVQRLKGRRVKVMDVTFREPVAASELEVAGITAVESRGRHYRVSVKGDVNALLQAVARHRVENLTFADASLEEIFLEYYGREATPAAVEQPVRAGG